MKRSCFERRQALRQQLALATALRSSSVDLDLTASNETEFEIAAHSLSLFFQRLQMTFKSYFKSYFKYLTLRILFRDLIQFYSILFLLRAFSMHLASLLRKCWCTWRTGKTAGIQPLHPSEKLGKLYESFGAPKVARLQIL